VRQTSEMENQLNAVERVLEYAKVVPEETFPAEEGEQQDGAVAPATGRRSAGPARSRSLRLHDEAGPEDLESGGAHSGSHVSPGSSGAPPPGWPSAGAISVQDLSISSRPDFPLVLSGVNAEIRPGEKIGIVGRTGAG